MLAMKKCKCRSYHDLVVVVHVVDSSNMISCWLGSRCSVPFIYRSLNKIIGWIHITIGHLYMHITGICWCYIAGNYSQRIVHHFPSWFSPWQCLWHLKLTIWTWATWTLCTTMISLSIRVLSNYKRHAYDAHAVECPLYYWSILSVLWSYLSSGLHVFLKLL